MGKTIFKWEKLCFRMSKSNYQQLFQKIAKWILYQNNQCGGKTFFILYVIAHCHCLEPFLYLMLGSCPHSILCSSFNFFLTEFFIISIIYFLFYSSFSYFHSYHFDLTSLFFTGISKNFCNFYLFIYLFFLHL